MTEIIKDEWIAQVTEGSRHNWVVVHLYQDSIVECKVLDEALLVVAKKFKYIKFLKIRSTQAIENWPEKNLPTLFCYFEEKLGAQLITLKDVGGKSLKAPGIYCNFDKNLILIFCFRLGVVVSEE